ncbi:MAG: hypothetical protein WC511_01580 [Candidatus Pacearchaeota archaeon]
MKIYNIPYEYKVIARKELNSAVHSGTVKRKRYCEICRRSKSVLLQEYVGILYKKTPKPIHAHHPNYRYPLWVWWLCKDCHSKLHAVQREKGIACLSLNFAKKLLLQSVYKVSEVIP